MKHFAALILAAAVVLSGCAQFDTDQRDTSITAVTHNLDGTVTTTTTRTVTTKATATAVAASKQALGGWSASQSDKKQGASVNGLSQESDAAPLAEALARGAVSGAVSSMIPIK